MPAFRHGKLTAVVLSDFNATPYLNSAEPSRTVDTAEASVFGANAKEYVAGQSDGTISYGGLYDGTADAIDGVLTALADADGNWPATIFHDEGIKPGSVCRLASVRKTEYSISSPTSEVVSLTGTLQCDGGIFYGRALTTAADVNANVTGPTVDYGAAYATWAGKGRVHLHVPRNTRNTATAVTVQHSSDGSVWVDLVTQSVSAGQKAALSLPLNGPLNRYVRALITPTTGTGNIQTIVAFARG